MSLTTEQIQANKLKYFDLLSKLNIDLTELSKFLDSIGFYTQPASTQSFRAYPGGLCENALNFVYELGQLCNAYFPGKYTEQDIIKVMFGKDLYRALMYEQYEKNVKNANGQWEAVQAYRTKEVRPTFGDLGFSSYMVAKKFMYFTDEQALAIVHSRSTDFAPDVHDIMKSYPLVTLTRMADLAAGYLTE